MPSPDRETRLAQHRRYNHERRDYAAEWAALSEEQRERKRAQRNESARRVRERARLEARAARFADQELGT